MIEDGLRDSNQMNNQWVATWQNNFALTLFCIHFKPWELGRQSKKMEVKRESESHAVVSDSLWPLDCSPQAPLPMESSRPEYWGGQPSPPSPGTLPYPGIEPRSPTLQADSLPAEPTGKPENTGVGSLSVPQRIFPTQGLNQHIFPTQNRTTYTAGGFFISWATREALKKMRHPQTYFGGLRLKPVATAKGRETERAGVCGASLCEGNRVLETWWGTAPKSKRQSCRGETQAEWPSSQAAPEAAAGRGTGGKRVTDLQHS